MGYADSSFLRRPICQSWPRDAVTATPCASFASSEDFFRWLTLHLKIEGELSGTESAICEQLLAGRSYLEVAQVRGVSPETIKWHVKRILRKLDLCSTKELLWVVGYRIDVLADD